MGGVKADHLLPLSMVLSPDGFIAMFAKLGGAARTRPLVNAAPEVPDFRCNTSESGDAIIGVSNKPGAMVQRECAVPFAGDRQGHADDTCLRRA